MQIYPITDSKFRQYGAVTRDFDCAALASAMKKLPIPQGVVYVPSSPELEVLDIFGELERRAFGAMPIQLGFCCGHNRRLDALEYHKSAEWNFAATPLILLLGRRQDIEPETLSYDTSRLEAFYVEEGTAFETYSETLHYAPCGVDGAGFCMAVVLPRGSNLALETAVDAPLLACRNKWLLAHPEASVPGAYIGLRGENPRV